MRIKTVTITGADDNTDINEIIRISKKYPFVEWGILFSPKRIREARYPSLTWVSNLKGNGLTLSAHICGGYSKEAITKGTISDFFGSIGGLHLFSMFNRVQLNFNATKHDVDFDSFFGRLDLDSDVNPKFILQYNKSNSVINAEVTERDSKRVHFLYDSSGGRGALESNWKGTIGDYFTGYAGGLTPDNLEEELQKISLQTNTYDTIWIDTETGVRTDDVLDLNKVEKFLEIALKHTTYA